MRGRPVSHHTLREIGQALVQTARVPGLTCWSIWTRRRDHPRRTSWHAARSANGCSTMGLASPAKLEGRFARMGKVVQARLTGPAATLGQVAAADVAYLFLGLERAIARASGHILGRRVKARGRREALIASASRLRLVSIEPGSVVGVLELPDVQGGEDDLDIGEVATLSEAALVQTIETASGRRTGYRDVTRTLVNLADQLGIGSRYDAFTIEIRDGGHAAESAVVDSARREHLRRAAGLPSPESAEDTVVGALVEADFENLTARLRTAANQPVEVKFEFEQADDVQKALRGQAEVVGEVTYDPESLVAKSVHVRSVTRAEQLRIGLDTGEFWSTRSVGDLATERGFQPVRDASALRDTSLSEQDVDAFLEAIGQ